jgi:predicted aminopeptidase
VKNRICYRLAGGVWLLALVALALTGCESVGYYGQAIRGQCQLIHRQRSIQEILADPASPEPLKEQLQLVLKIRQFAEQELKLHCNGHYLSYADLQRPFVVWNVHAAPEFSLKPKKWWYPVVGRLDYQGYFNEARADRYAATLQREGFDVYVGGVTAYSTLGWFRDPVLNTFVGDDEADLAELLFHELAHQCVFVASDTDFNEAFATAVAEEGLRRWMSAGRNSQAYERYRAAVARKERFVQLVSTARTRLEELYGETNAVPATANDQAGAACAPLSEGELRWQKQRVFDQLRRDYEQAKTQWGGNNEYDGWFQRPLNNAQLNTVDTYYKLVPSFLHLLEVSGGDMEKFYGEVKAIGKLKKEERRQRLSLPVLQANR